MVWELCVSCGRERVAIQKVSYLQVKVEKELEEYNAKEDEEREKMFGKGDRKE